MELGNERQKKGGNKQEKKWENTKRGVGGDTICFKRRALGKEPLWLKKKLADYYDGLQEKITTLLPAKRLITMG
jgi:hypothetical protein